VRPFGNAQFTLGILVIEKVAAISIAEHAPAQQRDIANPAC
jgi:hypothetical protein